MSTEVILPKSLVVILPFSLKIVYMHSKFLYIVQPCTEGKKWKFYLKCTRVRNFCTLYKRVHYCGRLFTHNFYPRTMVDFLPTIFTHGISFPHSKWSADPAQT